MNAALLIDLLNRRPAMNAGLIEAYAHWNAEVYRVMGALSTTAANEPTGAQQPATSAAAVQTIPGVQWQCGQQANGFTAPQADSKPATVDDLPTGAIINGRALAERLENSYNFECEAGPLRMCSDWQEFVRCFDYLATWVESRTARAPAYSVTAPAGGVAAGIEAAAKLLERKADDFARENGSDDLGGLSFGRGAHADAKLEYHSTLLELAEEIRSLAPTPPTQTADSVLEDAARYRLVRRGQHWSVINGIGDALRGEELDAAVDAARKQGATMTDTPTTPTTPTTTGWPPSALMQDDCKALSKWLASRACCICWKRKAKGENHD